jgi:MFS family permease
MKRNLSNNLLLKEKESEEHKQILLTLTEKFKNHNKYQNILFIIYVLASYYCGFILVIYPTQKNLPEYKCLDSPITNNTFPNNKNYIKNFQIFKDKKCINKYCDFSLGNFTSIAVDTKSLLNFITINDSFCNFEDFFILINFLINFGKIIGSLSFSYISDKYGRLYTYKLNIYLAVFFYLGIFIFDSKFFFYCVIFFTGMNVNLFHLLMALSSEMMNSDNFSLFSAVMGVMFAFAGILNIALMYIFKNVYFIFFIQLIIVLIILYYSDTYIKESFPFIILKKKDYNQCLNDMLELNKSCRMELLDDPKYSQMFNKVANFIKNETNENNNFNLEKNNNTKNTVDTININYNINTDFDLKKKTNQNSTKNLMENLPKDYDYNYNYNKKRESFNSIKSYFIQSSPINIIKKKNNNDCKTLMQTIFGPFKEIFENKKYTYEFLYMFPLFVTVNGNYFGQLLNIEKIAQNVYLGSLLLFIAEAIGEASIGYFLRFTERKKILTYVFLFSTINYSIVAFLNESLLSYFLIFLGNIATASLYITVYVFGVETFDVEVKNSMISLMNNSYCIYLMFLPYILKIIPNIFILFASCSFICYIIVPTFDETLKTSNSNNVSSHI